MKNLLSIKFIVFYVIFGVLAFFVTSTLGRQWFEDHLIRKEADQLYKEANRISGNAAGTSFLIKYDLEDLDHSLKVVASAQDVRILLVDVNGTLIIDTGKEFETQREDKIEGFDYARFGPGYYVIDSFYQYFTEPCLNVMMPVASGMNTKGYVSIHRPMRSIVAERDRCVNYLMRIAAIIYVLSFMILILFFIAVVRPLNKIKSGVKEMADGHLDHRIEVVSSDEIGTVAESINHMAERLKETADTQKEFISNISHDFRSPLTSIKGFTEAMIDGTIPQSDQEKYLRIIAAEAERLENLSTDTLTLSNLDTKEQTLHTSDFDLNEVIRNSAAVFEGICRRKRISFDLLLVDKSLPVHADKQRIQQVLYNLIDNAVKFSGEDSTITIETSLRHGKAEIRIKDEGIGIKKEDLDKIWNRFYKADDSRGMDKMGTGLGLSIVREILRQHEQTITVQSREGHGTEFVFTLDLA